MEAEADSSFVQSNPYATNVDQKVSVPLTNVENSHVVPCRWPSVYCKLQKSKKIVCKSMLPCLATTLALLAVWGIVVLATVFYAWPLAPPDGQKHRVWVRGYRSVPLASTTLCTVQANTRNASNGTQQFQGGVGSNTTCHKSLMKDPETGLCDLLCADWDWHTESERIAQLVATYLNMIVPTVSGIVATITWIKLGTLWSFPHIIPWYMVQCIFVYGVVNLIAFVMGREEAYCSHKSMIQTINDPTVFCRVSGAIMHFVLVAWSYWWVLAVSNLWWTIIFPAKKHLIFNNSKKLHVIQSVIAWGIPAVLVGVVLAVEGHYSTLILTPEFCSAPSKIVNYYTYGVPTQINVGIAASLLIWICCKLRRQIKRRSFILSNRLSTHVYSKNFVESLQDVEKRLLVVLLGLSIVSTFILITYMVTIRNSDRVTASLINYLGCIHFYPRDECPQQFQEHINTNLMIISNYIWPAFFLFIMIFLLSYKDVRQLWFGIITCRFCSRTKSTDTEQQNSRHNHENKLNQINTSNV